MTVDLEDIVDALQGVANEAIAVSNPPGRSEIDYRFADYQTFRAAMLAGLEVVEIGAKGETPTHPLAGSNIDPQTDWMIALIDAWAVVGDILTFYQERIANEGYFATAREQISREQLIAMIGVRRGSGTRATPQIKPASPATPPATVQIVPRGPVAPSQLGPAGPVFPTPGAATAVALPATTTSTVPSYDSVIDPGAAAVTDVAFVLKPHRVSGGRALIRAGTAIRSHRVDGSMPVVFETGSDLDARIEYNAISAFSVSTEVAPLLTAASVGLSLAGTATSLRAGSSILVTGTRPASAGSAPTPFWLYGTLVTVEPNQALGYTLVTWTAPAPDGSGGLLNQGALGNESLGALQVVGFGRSLPSFGSDAQAFSAAPLATQIAFSSSGGVSLGTSDPLLPIQPPIQWKRVNTGLQAGSLSALAMGNDGTAWIGGAFGVASLPPGGSGAWTLTNSGLGSAEVISLTVATDGSLWAGTSTGQVFRTQGRGQGWSAIAGSFMILPNNTPFKTSLPRTPITAIQPYLPEMSALRAPPCPPAAALAGTGLGVFGNALDTNGWLTDNARITGSGGSGAGSQYTSSPLVDLRVLTTEFPVDSAITGGYALAAAPDELVAFTWNPFDPPSTSSSSTPCCMPQDLSLLAPYGLPSYGKVEFDFQADIVEVTFFALDQKPGLLVLTSASPWLWDPTTATFLQVAKGLKRPLQSVAAVPAGGQMAVPGVVVGNDGTSVWVLSALTWQWSELPGFPGSTSDVPATQPPSIATLIAASSTGVLLAAAPLVLAQEWPDFTVVQPAPVGDEQPASTWIDVAGKPFDLAPASWVVVITSAATPTPVRVFQLLDSAVAYRDAATAYGQPGRVFRMFVGDVQGLLPAVAEPFTPRDAEVLARSFALGVYQPVTADDRPVHGTEIELAGILDGLDEYTGTRQGQASRPLAFTGQRPRLCVTLSGGLWRALQGSTARTLWREQGFAFQTITALLSAGGELWVGTASSGVYARTTSGTWENRSTGLGATGQTPPIIALAGGDQGVLVATSGGAARWDPTVGAWSAVTTLTGKQPLTLAVSEADGGAVTWWAGTSRLGLWTSSDGAVFAPAENAAALIGVELCALAVVEGTLVVGTAQGVYRYRSSGRANESQLDLISSLSTTALAGQGSSLLIGTADQGVLIIADLDAPAGQRPAGLVGSRINVLTGDGQRWYAGTAGAGVFSSADAATWTSMPIGAANDVRALVVDPAEDLYAGSAETVQLRSDSGVVAGELVYSNKLVLPSTFGAELFQLLVSARLRSAFAAVQITLPADARLTTLDKQATSLDKRGRWLLTSSSDVSAPVYLLCVDVLEAIRVIEANTIPIVTGPWSRGKASSGLRTVELNDGSIQGYLLLGHDQWTLRPPQLDDDDVSEVGLLSGVEYQYSTNATRVVISAPLTYAYARSTLHVSANVSRASQGETVNGEILGGGNSGVPNQVFTLRRAPLTFLPVLPPEYRRSTLSITVSQVEWDEVASFADSGPTDRVYTVTIDHEGRATVTFGDGTDGARLVAGTQNVVATYRVGLGLTGDVSSGTLDVMLSPPPGVQSVTNPIPATEGVAPMTAPAMLQDVPRLARTGNRVVNLRDHADLANSYPGVRQAKAASVRGAPRTWIQISVAFDSSVADTEISSRCSALVTSIAGAQVQPAAPIAVGAAPLAYFRLTATVRISAESSPPTVSNLVVAAIVERWSVAAASVGEDVRAGAIEAVIQAVPGVQGTQVTALARSGTSQDKSRVLLAIPAHYDAKAQSPVPAELLIIDPAADAALPTITSASGTVFVVGGITLQMVAGSNEAGS